MTDDKHDQKHECDCESLDRWRSLAYVFGACSFCLLVVLAIVLAMLNSTRPVHVLERVQRIEAVFLKEVRELRKENAQTREEVKKIADKVR